jgi:hypothetical protein
MMNEVLFDQLSPLQSLSRTIQYLRNDEGASAKILDCDRTISNDVGGI